MMPQSQVAPPLHCAKEASWSHHLLNVYALLCHDQLVHQLQVAQLVSAQQRKELAADLLLSSAGPSDSSRWYTLRALQQRAGSRDT
jgi:hypothetical protein